MMIGFDCIDYVYFFCQEYSIDKCFGNIQLYNNIEILEEDIVGCICRYNIDLYCLNFV